MVIQVVNISKGYWRYVSLCTHIDKGQMEFEQAAAMRQSWLTERTQNETIITKVAIDESGNPLGFVHLVPIESPLSAMRGKELWVIPCLTINYHRVYHNIRGSGVGRLLVQACEDYVKQIRGKGLAVYAYSGDMWFMPAAFFKKVGFTHVLNTSNIWVRKWAGVDDPLPLVKRYEYLPVQGKVVIDYFWSPFCLTSCQEVLNIREVVSEFRDRVVFREYRSDDADRLKTCGLVRALFINGKHVNWGYAAPKEEMRNALRKLLG
jgi:GNAT superfamily N-acetyltransferase